MSTSSRRLAGTLLILLPTVVFGGVSILSLLTNDPRYRENALWQDLWRAGHAHAGVLLVLSLIALRYVDEAALGRRARAFTRYAFPASAVFLSAGFFLSVLTPEATQPNSLIILAYLGAIVLVAATLVLGVGLIRRRPDERRSTSR